MLEDHLKGHITLSNEQITILNVISRGESIFLIGSPSSGKSYLLNFVVKILKKLDGLGSIFIRALTNIVTCHLSGMTLHYFDGVTLFVVTKQGLLILIEKKKGNVNR